MAIRPIVTWPDPVLKQRCAEVVAFDADLHQLLGDMAETMKDEGIGLAANQVGVTLRVFVMDVPLGEGEHTGVLEIINPRIVKAKGEIRYEEGCLSFPGVNETVKRAAEVDLAYQDRHGVAHEVHASGLVAICIQHELDHLDGIVFLDRLSPLKRRIALRDYLRENREQIEEAQHRAKSKLRRSAAS